jgi:MFS transporter, SP family, sugar:H+ symporter
MFQLGGLIINAVVRGTSVYNDRRAYTIPYGLFYIVPVIVASLIWLIPEVGLLYPGKPARHFD